MASGNALVSWLTLALAPLAASGCLVYGSSHGTSSGGREQLEEDVAQYDALRVSLEARRTVFKQGGQSGLTGVGTRLFWLEAAGGAPTLHSFETKASRQIDYGFSIGSGAGANYRAGEGLVVTEERVGGTVVFHAFTVDQPQGSAGDLSVPAPEGAASRWAYAPGGQDVYYVTTGTATTLWKWTPGGGAAPGRLFDLEDAGIMEGGFEDFGVDGNTMVLVESGQVWTLDIAAEKATPLGNQAAAQSLYPDRDGVLFGTAAGPFFYGYADQRLRDVGVAIAASGFRINATFANAQVYDQDLARDGSVVGYIGKSGMFTFDLGTGLVAPVLLDARDQSTVYRHPVILSDGSLFVQGLQSNDGEVGTDGPIYRVQLSR
jgi:hypothetical protein